MPDYNFLFD